MKLRVLVAGGQWLEYEDWEPKLKESGSLEICSQERDPEAPLQTRILYRTKAFFPSGQWICYEWVDEVPVKKVAELHSSPE